MNDLAPWLVLFIVGLPLIGALTALALLARGRSRHESAAFGNVATACVRYSMLAAFCSALLLVALFSGAFGVRIEEASWCSGPVLELTGPRPLRIEWAWRADLFTAGWIATLNGLSGLVLATARRDTLGTPRTALAMTAGLLNLAATMLVVSASLAQLLVCWGAVSWATWLMVGWTARDGEPARDNTPRSSSSRNNNDGSREDGGLFAVRRAIVTGLIPDGLLVLAVLLMSVTCRTLVIDDIVSAEGLAMLGEHNPALPGFIGCLLVLSVLGRSGLFPSFGWHSGAAAWDWPVWTMVYLVGYVPAAVWLLLRFQPLIASSDAPRTLLGGLSTLGAVLGAFVACGQARQRSAAAFLVTAQIGVVYAALAGGLFDAESWGAWWLGATAAAPPPSDVGRVVLGQLAVLSGVVFVWQRSRAPCVRAAREAWYQPLVQLSQRRLYVDEVVEFLCTSPLQTWVKLARHGERLLTDGLFPTLTVRLPGWFAQQFEALQTGHVEFDLAAALLGVVAVLLTLLLVM